MVTYEWRDASVEEFKQYISQGYTLKGVVSYGDTWGVPGRDYVQLQSPQKFGEGTGKYNVVGFAIKEGISPQTFQTYRSSISQQQRIPTPGDFPEKEPDAEAYERAVAARDQRASSLPSAQQRFYSSPGLAPLTEATSVQEKPGSTASKSFPGTVPYVTTKEIYKQGLRPVGYGTYVKQKAEVEIEPPSIEQPRVVNVEPPKAAYLTRKASEYEIKALRTESPFKKAYYTGVQTAAEVSAYVIPRIKSAAIIAAAPIFPTLAGKEFMKMGEGVKYVSQEIKVKGTEYAYEKGEEFGTSLYQKPASTLTIIGLEVLAAKGVGKLVSTAFPPKVKTTQVVRLQKETTVPTPKTVVLTEEGATRPITAVTSGKYVEAMKIKAKTLLGTRLYGYLGEGKGKVLSAEGKVNLGKLESTGTLYRGEQEVAAIKSTSAFISQPSLLPRVRQFITKTITGKKVSIERGVQYPVDKETTGTLSFTGKPGKKPELFSAGVTKQYLEIKTPKGISRQFVTKEGGITPKEFKKSYSEVVIKPKQPRLPAPETKASMPGGTQSSELKQVVRRPKILSSSKDVVTRQVVALESARLTKAGTIATLSTRSVQKLGVLPKQKPSSKPISSSGQVPMSMPVSKAVTRAELSSMQVIKPKSVVMPRMAQASIPVASSMQTTVPIMDFPRMPPSTPGLSTPALPKMPPVPPIVLGGGFGSEGKGGYGEKRIKGSYTPSVAGLFFRKPIKAAPKMKLTGFEIRPLVKAKSKGFFSTNKFLRWKL